MITKRTVFVLGAGASQPFGFPTGIELARELSTRFGQRIYVEQLAEKLHPKFSMKELINFRDEFYYSGRNSVDAFLEHRDDLVEIGKYATAALLIAKENSDRLFSYDHQNWLRFIYGRMQSSFENFAANRISFVTFNYDRSVEHFLFTALKNSFGHRREDEIAMIFDSIPVIHLHGSLGPLPWQSDNGRSFNIKVNRAGLEIAASSIKIIHEDIKDGRDADFRLAKHLMHEADHIYFLGFGFNPTNNERLAIRHLRKEIATATGKDLVQNEIVDIQNACDGRVKVFNEDCLSFLRNHAKLG